jgi:hypothetical protein
MALRPWMSVKALPGVAKEKARAIINGWLIGLRTRVNGRDLGPAERAALPPEEALGEEMARRYAAELGDQKLTQALVNNVVAFLDSPEEDEGRGGPPTMGRLGDAIKLRLVNAALGALVRFHVLQQTGAEFSTADHPKEAFALSANGRFEGDIKVVIYGHTHEALKTEFGPDRLYVNSGTWANLVRLPGRGEDRLAWLRTIHDNTFDRTFFPTYVRIEPSAVGAKVSLCVWEGGAKELWAKDMSR